MEGNAMNAHEVEELLICRDIFHMNQDAVELLSPDLHFSGTDILNPNTAQHLAGDIPQIHNSEVNNPSSLASRDHPTDGRLWPPSFDSAIRTLISRSEYGKFARCIAEPTNASYASIQYLECLRLQRAA
jgi:hypothetical protein